MLDVTREQIIWGGNYFADLLPPKMGWLYWLKLIVGDFSDGELAWTSRDRALKEFSVRKTNAEILMNYYYQPEVAAEVAAWVNYVTPVEGAYDAAMAIDPELAENQLIFPNADTLSQVKAFKTLDSAEDNEYQAAFQAVVLGA
jgi:hypothetical protein